ncbi:MAG: hypothetical protein VKJ64_10300, partial [Leptolyngbyaceae bacterium]|nr:hypothetical protein [Leptolyngbyaceae bacterium]
NNFDFTRDPNWGGLPRGAGTPPKFWDDSYGYRGILANFSDQALEEQGIALFEGLYAAVSQERIRDVQLPER